MKRYKLLRIIAICFEVFSYVKLIAGLLISILLVGGFNFAFLTLLPTRIACVLSSTIGFIFLIATLISFAITIAIAQIINVVLHSYDNSNKILDLIATGVTIHVEETQKEATPLSNWLKANPGKGINDFYSK